MNEQEIKLLDTDALLKNIQQKLTESSERDKKGRIAIVRILTSDHAIRLIENTADSLGIEPITVGRGLALAMSKYHSGQPINVKELGAAINQEGVGVRFGRETIIPLAVELGFIVNMGDRSTHWQQWDKIGAKPTLLDTCKALLAPTAEQQAIKAAAQRAYAEKCKLNADLKREAYATKRKESAMRTQNTITQADELAAANPVPQTWVDTLKANPMGALVVGLLVVGVTSSLLTSGNQQPVSPLLATMQTEPTLPATNGLPTLDPQITQGSY